MVESSEYSRKPEDSVKKTMGKCSTYRHTIFFVENMYMYTWLCRAMHAYVQSCNANESFPQICHSFHKYLNYVT